MKKKIVLLCAVYCLAIGTAIWMHGLLAEIVVVFLGLILLFGALFKCARLPFVAVALCVFFVGFTQTEYKNNTSNYMPTSLDGMTVYVQGDVCEVRLQDDRTTYVLKPKSMYIRLQDGGEEHFVPKGKIFVLVWERFAWLEPYKFGDFIEVRGTLQLPKPTQSKTEFDYGQYNKVEGIYASIYTEEQHALLLGKAKVNPVLRAASAARTFVCEKIRRGIGGDAGALLSGIMISEHSDFSPTLERALRKAGLSHICAVSGMHVSILCSILMWIFVRLRLRRGIYYPICALALHFFAWMSGSGASIMRAVWMFDLCMLAYWTRGDEDRPFTCLCVGWLMLIVQPLYLFDAGFLLSFASIFGILFLSGKLEKFLGRYIRLKVIRSALGITLCAQLFTLPILAGAFHAVSPYAVLYNVLLTWLVAPVMILGVIYILVSLIWSGGAQVIGILLKWILQGICTAVLSVDLLPFGSISVKGDALFCVFYIALLALLYALGRKEIIWSHICSGIVCACMIIYTVSNCLGMFSARVHFLNVGEGDCALLQLPYDINILVDAGGSVASAGNVGTHKVVPYLRSQGVTEIDCAIVSHYDADHAQGMLAVCEQLKVRRLILPYRKDGYTEQYKTALEEIAAKRKIRVEYVRSGDAVALPGGLQAQVLSPDPELIEYCTSENDLSLVLRLTYGKLCMLFTGDIEMLAEGRLLRSGVDMRADLLKVAHHGAQTSSSDSFVDAVSPRLAVISSGDYAVSEHPALHTLLSLKQAGAVVEQTAISGDLVYEITKWGALRVR